MASNTTRSKKCPRCGTEFTPPDWRAVHCSVACAQIKDMPSKPCAHCGQTFRKSNEDSHSRWQRRKFCSRRCMGAARTKQTGICKGCGGPTNPLHPTRPFCGAPCYHAWISANASLDPSANGFFSKRAKRLLIARAENRCQACGSTDRLEFDHIIPQAAGGLGVMDNGQVLCHDCHMEKTLDERRLIRRLLRAHFGMGT